MRRYRSRRIAMVFQEPMSSLNPVINIETQLTEGMITQLSLTNRQAKDRALELLETVGISDPERRLAQSPTNSPAA
ncbi:Oligopeptide transport ATP-binding protein OppD [Geodia barretti]|uniref:Oligopeptide transport ATP-binding protein OppD n=1 Tax=Geodia barretti TaxID=519541 RepID=A0AA35W490_GEOBA|nr:Oligopeptide transport ATP-binding protein OppD [Geodia barretti]